MLLRQRRQRTRLYDPARRYTGVVDWKACNADIELAPGHPTGDLGTSTNVDGNGYTRMRPLERREGIGQQTVGKRRHRDDADSRKPAFPDVPGRFENLVEAGEQTVRFPEEGVAFRRQAEPLLRSLEQLEAEFIL